MSIQLCSIAVPIDCKVTDDEGSDTSRGQLVAVARDFDTTETNYLFIAYGGKKPPRWVAHGLVEAAWPGSVRTRE